MNRKEFFEKLPKRFTAKDRLRIQNAYWLAKETHREQIRRTGERYFEHPRRVAYASLPHRPDDIRPNEIIVSLIHDCDEDGFIPKNLVIKLFGVSVAKALDALSKVTLTYNNATGRIQKHWKENPKYYRVIANSPAWIQRIKIADRIDNLRDINNDAAWTEEKRQTYIRETKKYILPIAEKTDTRLWRLLKKRIAS